MNNKYVLILCLISLTFSCHKKDDYPIHQTIEEMNQWILEEMEKEDIPSLVVGIIKEDELVWHNAYGYHHLQDQIPPTEETVYLLASISKTFTTVAIMQLYERGDLELDKDINSYLPFEVRNPHFPDQPITCRMLLTHTSGLSWPTNEEDPDFNNTYPEDTAPDLFPWIKEYISPDGPFFRSNTWKATPPGESFQYTNVGVALLGYIVASVSGQDFSEYCQANIFQPLKMMNSGYRFEEVAMANLATLYHEGEEIEQYSVSHYPSSTVRSSLAELSHFLIAIINGGIYKNNRILKKDTVEEMLAIQYPLSDIALVWQRFDNSWMGHTGGYWGVSSCFDLHQKHKMGVIILTNTYGKESLYPEGRIYTILHHEAAKYFE